MGISWRTIWDIVRNSSEISWDALGKSQEIRAELEGIRGEFMGGKWGVTRKLVGN